VSRSFRKYSAGAGLCLLTLSCAAYLPVRLETGRLYEYALEAERRDPEKPGPAPGRGNEPWPGDGRRLYMKKYFALVGFPGPAGRINNRAVALARQRKFRSAQALLEEAAKEDPRMGAAFNNLGIVHEIFGEREKSFEHYSRACLLEPDNEIYRKNFLYRTDDGRPRKP